MSGREASGAAAPAPAMSFWEHLDALRSTLLRAMAAATLAGVGAFCLKDGLFRLVFWPREAGFPLYRWLGTPPFRLQLVNTQLTEQFMVHMKVALAAGLLAASPYIIYALFGFVRPALYEHELRHSRRLLAAAYAMFLLGLAANYLLVFPLTVRFLGTYSVSPDVHTMLSLSSYVDTLLVMSLVFGTLFELPVVAWMLARLGMLRAAWMTRYRRHAIVAILVVAAAITPTADMMTLVAVSLPIWMLYEISILIVRLTGQADRHGQTQPDTPQASAS